MARSFVSAPRWEVFPTHVGASEVGAVLGCDPWTTPLQLYRRKLGLEPARDQSPAMAIGSALEGSVVALARPLLLERVRRNTTTFVQVDGPLFATPDAFVGRDRLLEAKVLGLRSPEAFEDELACRVQLQVQAQLLVTGREAGYVVQLVGTELRLAVVAADPVVQATIAEAAAAFVELLAERTPPDPLSWDERWAELLAQLGPMPERDVLAGGDVQDAGDRLLAIRQLEGQLADEARQLRLELLEALAAGQGTRLVGAGWTGQLQTRAGAVDWRGVQSVVDIDPEVINFHRGPDVTSFVVRSSSRDS